MADFSHLNRLSVADDATAEYVFYAIQGEPTLVTRYAGETNKEFFNAVLKQTKAASRRRRKNSTPTSEDLERVRREDAALFARYLIVDWSGVLDSNGQEVEFTVDNCEQFLRAIPSDMFNQLRAFCLDIENFRDLGDEMEPEELEELRGN